MKKNLLFLTVGLIGGGISGVLVGRKFTFYQLNRYLDSEEAKKVVKEVVDKRLNDFLSEVEG